MENLDRSIQFYSTQFGASPARVEADYAKWMLEDFRMNFAISTHRQPVGVNHLGFQVDTDEELRGMHSQLEAADSPDPQIRAYLLTTASQFDRLADYAGTHAA